MLFLENILLALNGLRANKMRSLLTMLGIIIGIASVITIMSIGSSLTSSVQQEMEGMGAANITMGVQQKQSDTITSGSGFTFNDGPRRQQLADDDYIDGDMIEDVLAQFPDELEKVLKENTIGNGTLKHGDDTAAVSMKGADNANIENADLEMLAGRTFTERDQTGKKKVVILSDSAVDDVLKVSSYEKALGRQVTVVLNNNFYHYTVVGVYKHDDSDATYSFGADDSTTLYMPILTSFDDAHTRERYNNVTLVSSASVDIDSLIEKIEKYMNGRYYRNNDNFEIECYSMSSMLESLTSMMSTISLAISAIAGISLLVGGIGVMNIMLVSIQERTREIGTRKALGATNSSIRMQFIVESIVLCLVGGIIGIILGLTAAYFATPLLADGASFTPSLDAILLSVGFSAAVGIFFGYYPANKAAKMNPIDALRYE